MQIPDRSREWFVYHMMRQAEKNNLKMAGILDGFDKKLKFLAQNDQAECPVCFEPFQDWMRKVLEVQNQRNPEELETLRSRIEQARQHEVCARKCKAVKGLAVRSRALAAEGLKQMASSNAPEEYMAV